MKIEPFSVNIYTSEKQVVDLGRVFRVDWLRLLW